MTTDQARVGLLLAAATAARIAPLARSAEEAGFDELWVAEDYFETSGPVSAALALDATSAIPVGIGVASVATRHPALLAMDAATLAGAHPGRLTLGMGTGMTHSLDQLDVAPKSPLATVRHAVDMVGTLLAGETVSGDVGPFRLEGVALAHTPDEAPTLMVGGLGPRMLELGGEVADGVILSSFSSPAYVTWARERVAAGAARASRPTPGGPCFAWICIDEDRDRARSTMRGIVAGVLGALGPMPLTDPDGISEPLAEMLARGGTETVAAEMPDEWAEQVAIAGDADDCVTAIRRRLDAGADSVVLLPMPPDDRDRRLDLIAARVLPELR